MFYDKSVNDNKKFLYSQIPSVSKLLEAPFVQELLKSYPRRFVVEAIGSYLSTVRKNIGENHIDLQQLQNCLSNIESDLNAFIIARLTPSLKKVINATGVIIYTNAGRSPISSEMLRETAELAGCYTNLEYDLDAGRRGHRDLHIESRIVQLMGCEAATVCNNAAAALLLILNTLAFGKKVLVSRGELIEIGGSFRLPAIMEKSGAILQEIGTTNKTKSSDYTDSIDEDTALILRVHPSNYQIVGFTQRPTLQELTEISRASGVPLLHDVGSGYLFSTSHPFLEKEPIVENSLNAGCDLICFSGDKLLGGPQAGLILGKRELVNRVRKNPLMRVMRVDKIIYSLLEKTLIEYEKGTFQENLPIWKFINLPVEKIKERASRILNRVHQDQIEIRLTDGLSLTGGGSAPEERIPTCLISLRSPRYSPNQLEAYLRNFNPPILSRIEKDQVILDLRTVFPEQDDQIVKAFMSGFNS